jgi:hypothetical protein
MRTVVAAVVDDGDFLEVQPLFAPNLVIGFGRVEGRNVGVVANQPLQLAGTLDIDASEKAARFVRTCDAFNSRCSRSSTYRLPARDRPGVDRHHPARARSSSTPTPRRPSR